MITKLLLSLIFLVSIHTRATAQESKLGWGAKIGFNVATINSSNPEDNESFLYKGDIIAGVFADYRALKWLSLGAEFLYSGQGLKSSEEEQVYVDISYLNLPILLNFHVTKGLALKTGIQFGYALALRFRIVDEAETPNIFDNIRPWSYSVPVGFSYTIRSGFVFDFRYTFDIKSLFPDVNERNSVFSVTLGLRL